MFDFLKKKESKSPAEKISEFLNIENSAFNTDVPVQAKSDNTDYQSFLNQEPVYDVPKYKARNTGDIGIVIDSNQIGFDKSEINNNIKTIELPNDDNETTGMSKETEISLNDDIEILDNQDVLKAETQVVSNPFEKENIISENSINKSENILNVLGNEKSNNNYSIFDELPKEQESISINNNFKNEDVSEEFSIFGSKDGLTSVNNYSTNDQFEEEKQELEQEVEYTKDGYKICPKCGAILNPDAPVCFMCSKSFILKNNFH